MVLFFEFRRCMFKNLCAAFFVCPHVGAGLLQARRGGLAGTGGNPVVRYMGEVIDFMMNASTQQVKVVATQLVENVVPAEVAAALREAAEEGVEDLAGRVRDAEPRVRDLAGHETLEGAL